VPVPRASRSLSTSTPCEQPRVAGEAPTGDVGSEPGPPSPPAMPRDRTTAPRCGIVTTREGRELACDAREGRPRGAAGCRPRRWGWPVPATTQALRMGPVDGRLGMIELKRH